MSKLRTKQFVLSNAYQLELVDRWWAFLLQGGTKIIEHVEWEALGEMVWRLRVFWRSMPGAEKLNVGHPQYSIFSTEEMQEYMAESLEDFEAMLQDFSLLEKKVKDWELKEQAVEGEESSSRLVFRESLDGAERIIATQFLWPCYKELKRNLTHVTTRMQEIDQELKARTADDYFIIAVDRGMLRSSFLEQVGYDNEWLFEESTGPFPPLSE